ncbi:hypothetical protein [Metapseudomonas furukawaii]|uniref:Uncharacterized protein n=1 Tax=Metapseudomonas furukawaii TaxID=1149133 RepID=A0AAD1C4V2_METFU|nr:MULTISPECIES: hypothetical protein [Pseudomonas]ELS26072.1 hypothetical protein ppKF707_2308 [Pseudomonas furukawaii]OWJ96919.1 hypothetical protein B6S59_05565 [Pseudomonas sp. A46]BAU76755.1 hypothetical protein KF707C_50670 [Pseudomonas furukawaii]
MADSRLLYEPELSHDEWLRPEEPDEILFRSNIPSREDRREPEQAPWIEYVAGQWVVLKRRRDAPPERRRFPVVRQRIEALLAKGWSITGRDPVRLERHQRVKIVCDGELRDI